jgi:galactokinase
LVLAWLGALAEHNKVKLDPWTSVKASQRVEHEYLGVLCGLLDQIGSQMSVANQVLAVDFQSLTVTPTTYSLPGYSWVAIHTGKSRELAESAYQTRVHECRTALENLNRQHSHIQTMRDVCADQVQDEDTLTKRVRHVVQENRRVEQALTCIQNDAQGLGRLLKQSHASLRDDYEVSCDELNTMVEIATSHDACVGARMMGGGFGGSTLNLVQTAKAQIFVDETLAQYKQHYPLLEPSALIAELVAGAASITL